MTTTFMIAPEFVPPWTSLAIGLLRPSIAIVFNDNQPSPEFFAIILLYGNQTDFT
jgi:hypothetical protein